MARHKREFNLHGISKEATQKLGISPPASEEEYLSPNEIGKMLNLTGEAVKQWIYTKKLPAVKLTNGYWKVKISELTAFLKNRGTYSCRKVLLATDNERHVKTVQKLGHEAILAGNFPDAILKAINTVPALVVIDMEYSQFKPWELARLLRDRKTTKSCKILLVGKDWSDQDTAKAITVRAEGAVDADRVEDEVLRIIGKA